MKKKVVNFLKKICWLPVGLLFVVALVVALTKLPFSPYKLYAVVSGSMAPSIKAGDLVLVDRNASFGRDDVITFARGDKLITHRIVGSKNVLKNVYFEVKGDANNASDPESVLGSDVVGKVVYAVPYLGLFSLYLKSWPGLFFLIVIPGVLFLLYEARSLWREIGLFREGRAS